MPYLDEIQWCARMLYERLKTLEADQLLELLAPPLTGPEVGWVLKRRDKVMERLDGLIAERGEAAVLF